MNTKIYRLREFIDPIDGKSLIIDTSAGLSLGPLPGLEHFMDAVQPVMPMIDGMLTSPGQSWKFAGRTRQDAALLVRADWTNALRGPEFVLPPETILHHPIISPREGIELGVSALVIYFLLGHEEQIEAGCLKTTVQYALQGSEIGIPLIVDVQPIGPRVVMMDKAIELGVSYALEGGADGIAIPWPGKQSFMTIRTMAADVPIWIKPSSAAVLEVVLTEALAQGATGVWLDENLFAQPDALALLINIARLVHPTIITEDVRR